MASNPKANISLLENYVIDWKEWDQFHPGGKYVLSKTRQKDITKYFNGGYALNPENKATRHLHSYQANEIASGLIIGQLEGQVGQTENLCKVASVEKLNASVSIFKLQSSNFPFMPSNWKHWYSDANNLGRYFVIHSQKYTQIKRQYVICNAARPEMQSELLTCMQKVLKGKGAISLPSEGDQSAFAVKNELFDKSLLSDDDKNSIYIVVKHYASKKGVSH